MRYLALACDYDDTLAAGGRVGDAALRALERFRRSGGQLVLITGRELGDLQGVFPGCGLFDRIVVENGAVLHDPFTGDTRQLADPPPAAFLAAIRERGVAPLSAGQVIVATHRAHERTIRETIADLRLDCQVIFNGDSLMVLPPRIDKASGLVAALAELDLSPDTCIGIGDAENDRAFLSICGTAVAVANALPIVREESNFVTKGSRGDGVAELIDLLIKVGGATARFDPPAFLCGGAGL